MKECYVKEYSNVLERDLEYAVFGKSGKPCFLFPELAGRFFDFKNFGLYDAVKPWIESGKVQIICTDNVDNESWADTNGDPRKRIETQEKWYHYVIDELYPQFVPTGEKAMVTGCSMGGYHAGIFFFRRPDLFDTMLSLSGLFNAQFAFFDYFDDLVYANSPIHFVADLKENDTLMEQYRKSTIITCVGQGLYEDELLKSTKEFDELLIQKNIPHWSDYWGFDVSHDWYWWKKQLDYFFTHIFGKP